MRVMGGAVIVAGVVVYAACFGFGDLSDYLRVLAYVGRHGEAFHANQSVNGLLNRLLVGPSPFQPDRYPPSNPGVIAGTVLSSAAIILLALFGPAVGPEAARRWTCASLWSALLSLRPLPGSITTAFFLPSLPSRWAGP